MDFGLGSNSMVAMAFSRRIDFPSVPFTHCLSSVMFIPSPKSSTQDSATTSVGPKHSSGGRSSSRHAFAMMQSETGKYCFMFGYDFCKQPCQRLPLQDSAGRFPHSKMRVDGSWFCMSVRFRVAPSPDRTVPSPQGMMCRLMTFESCRACTTCPMDFVNAFFVFLSSMEAKTLTSTFSDGISHPSDKLVPMKLLCVASRDRTLVTTLFCAPLPLILSDAKSFVLARDAGRLSRAKTCTKLASRRRFLHALAVL
mmetsp:Transcript_7709/g.17604  ORF Transcript_7709/g.17604 Transcript_7709/m.17604 type:complete len:253 (-) Transcript_7709:237-995(-)